MKVRTKIISAVTALAAGAGAGLVTVQSASAATVTVNGELCIYTYTQADADYLNIAVDAIESIEEQYYEADRYHYSYFSGVSVNPGKSVVKTVSDAQYDARWAEDYGVEWHVDQQIERAKSRAVMAFNNSDYNVDDALLLASWQQNSFSRDSLLRHEIDKACASGGSVETQLPEDPSFSPDKFPQWDLGEAPEEQPNTTGEATPSPEPNPTPTPSPDPTSTPTPSPEPNPTLTPSPDPTSTPTPSPEPNPTLTPSPNPTSTPTPSPEPNPTLTPTPTPEPDPTLTPTPTPEPDPTSTPTPTQEPDPTPTPGPGEVEQGSNAGSSDDDTDGLSPLLAVGGLVALIGVLVAVAPFLAPQLQALLP